MERWADVLMGAGAGFLLRLTGALLVLVGFWLAGRFSVFLITRFAQRSRLQREDIVRLLAQTVRTGLWVFGAVTALGTLGVNVAALVAGLGLTGFALGFALKDAISNLLAGMLLLLYRPFFLRDRITVAGLGGAVSDINLRYTVLEDDGRRFLIPNSLLFTNTVVVEDRRSVAMRPEQHPAGAR